MSGLSLRDQLGKIQSRATAPQHREGLVEVVRMSMSWGHAAGIISWLTEERLGISQERLVQAAEEREIWLLVPRLDLQIKQTKMDGR